MKKPYIVCYMMTSVDGRIDCEMTGSLLWKNNDEYDKPMIILTSEQVNCEYLGYLDSKGISYIATGTNGIDLSRATEILHDSFGIERLGIVGGSAINTAFLDAGLLDEIIILIGAGIDGRASFVPVFNRADESKAVVPLKLIEAKAFDSGTVMIRYKTIK